MRKLFWQMMSTLDGYMEGPDGDIDWHVADADFNAYVKDMLASIDAILLGRVTYELFAGYWPESHDHEAPAMNALPKIVFSRTLEKVDWKNSRLVQGDAADEVRRLKQQPEKDLALVGSADLASTFHKQGLIDEYRIFVNPVVLGRGNPTFKNVEDQARLKLAKTQTLGSGVVILTYEPVPR